MKSIYASPLRVYLALGLLALSGILFAFQLPISLFPNSSRPKIQAGVSYGGLSPDDFVINYGKTIENRLRAIRTQGLELEKLEATYRRGSVRFETTFAWGNDGEAAQREVETVLRSATSALPKETRDSVWVGQQGGNSGFFAASFYSETRDVNEIFKELEPVIVPRLAKIQDVDGGNLFNPNDQEIRVELRPERLASLQLFPSQIEQAITQFAQGYTSGQVQTGSQAHVIELRNPAVSVDALKQMPLKTSGGTLLLQDIASVELSRTGGDEQVLKTSGKESLILFARPKPGGNVKRMSEDVLALIAEIRPGLAKDIQFRVLVDPSDFIRGAVKHVFVEVLIGSALAVLILFIFIGSLKNVATAAIEIPLSMIVAFILMRFSGMNLNLISLGGLALASGMNVDASVVVMENIFRYFEREKGHLTYARKLELVAKAVAEVRLPIIASTIASLVVFAPLAFTSDLTYAVLGDLAKTVIFSHGLSAFIALLLVPTVRLQILARAKDVAKEIGRSPIEGRLQKTERGYARALGRFLDSPKLMRATWISIPLLLIGLGLFVLPRLPKEVLGKPDTDWLVVGVSSQTPLSHAKQNQALYDELEDRLLKKFGSDIDYTFSQVYGTVGGNIMARLKDKSRMMALWKEVEKEFQSTPDLTYWVEPWNPAELELPDPPEVEISVEGGTTTERQQAAESVLNLLQEKQTLPRWQVNPGVRQADALILRPMPEWTSGIAPAQLADLIRTATEGRTIHQMAVDGKALNIRLQFPNDTVRSAEDLASFPVGVQGRILPLRALTRVDFEPAIHETLRIDGREIYVIKGRKDASNPKPIDESVARDLQTDVQAWKSKSALARKVSVTFEDAKRELNQAVHQLSVAVLLSILLIFVTMIFQLGGILNALVVLVAVPLGLIGVLASLFIFQSSLSLNSILGVILLNGIAVANSILLVDFAERLFREGFSAREAVVAAAERRLRPILITSLTTILGMLPIAFGFGQGGRVLQPLGIAVSGGLWISMLLTLFTVPPLHYQVLKRRKAAQPSPTPTAHVPSEAQLLPPRSEPTEPLWH